MVTRLEDARIELRIDTKRAERRVRELSRKQEDVRRGRRDEERRERDASRGRRRGVSPFAAFAAGRGLRRGVRQRGQAPPGFSRFAQVLGATVPVAGAVAAAPFVLQGSAVEDFLESSAGRELLEKLLGLIFPDLVARNAAKILDPIREALLSDVAQEQLQKIEDFKIDVTAMFRTLTKLREFVREQLVFGREPDLEQLQTLGGRIAQMEAMELEIQKRARSTRRKDALRTLNKIFPGSGNSQ